MADLRVIKNTGAEASLGEPEVEEFKASLRGQLLRAGEDGYDEARKIWNGMIDKRPALIARCAGAADVINCVNFARANDLPVAVRGGGHNVAGNALCDGGITAVQPFSTGGGYVNYLGRETEEGAERIKAAYGPENYDRLVALKTKYDQTNLFRLNQNIKPRLEAKAQSLTWEVRHSGRQSDLGGHYTLTIAAPIKKLQS